MKAISLWQPWASLIAIGAKRIETRAWNWDYRGPLAIHAAKKWGPDLRELATTEPFLSAMRGAGVEFDLKADPAIPFGAIIATCRLIECAVIDAQRMFVFPSEPELSFGDYTTGRYAWFLTDVVKLARPIPWRGHQGPFDVPDEIIKQAMEAAA